ncbi:MAG: HPr kinase/phosphatase C-terminal domain-containing protein [Pseudomonadota bacterium]
MTGTLVHASAVAWEGRGVLVMGASGSGKSSLCLGLMAMGATLVSDDQTFLEASEGRIIARAPETLRGRIEARGIGLLRIATYSKAEIVLAVDLDRTADGRLPPRQSWMFKDLCVPLIAAPATSHLQNTVLVALRHGAGALLEDPEV